MQGVPLKFNRCKVSRFRSISVCPQFACCLTLDRRDLGKGLNSMVRRRDSIRPIAAKTQIVKTHTTSTQMFYAKINLDSNKNEIDERNRSAFAEKRTHCLPSGGIELGTFSSIAVKVIALNGPQQERGAIKMVRWKTFSFPATRTTFSQNNSPNSVFIIQSAPPKGGLFIRALWH